MTTWNVPGDFADLPTAYASGSVLTGDTIRVAPDYGACGAYLNVNRAINITIEGSTGVADDVVLTSSGGSYAILFNANGVTTTFKDLTISGSKAEGVILSYGQTASLGLDNAKVTNSHATGAGIIDRDARGGNKSIALTSGSVVTAVYAIYYLDNATSLSIDATSIVKSSGNYAIVVAAGQTLGTLTSSGTIGQATGCTSALSIAGTITTLSLTGGSLLAAGGVLRVENGGVIGEATIDGVTITGGTASVGAVYIVGTVTTLNLTDCDINNVLGRAFSASSGSPSYYYGSGTYWRIADCTGAKKISGLGGGIEIERNIAQLVIENNSVEKQVRGTANGGRVLSLGSEVGALTDGENPSPIGEIHVRGNTFTNLNNQASYGHCVLIALGAGKDSYARYLSLEAWDDVNGEAVAGGKLIRPNAWNGYHYRCSVAGTCDAVTEPVWPTTIGNTVVDGTATWICCRPGMPPLAGEFVGNLVIGGDYNLVVKWNSLLIEGNRIYGTTAGYPGFFLAGASNNVVRYNTILQTGAASQGFYDDESQQGLPATGNVVTDNIFAVTGAGSWALKSETTSLDVVDNNLYYAPNGYCGYIQGANKTTVADMQAAWAAAPYADTELERNDLNSPTQADPQFVSVDSGDADFLSIALGSPARGASSIPYADLGAGQRRELHRL